MQDITDSVEQIHIDSYDPLVYEPPQWRDGPASIYRSPRSPHQRLDMRETSCRGHTIQLWLAKHGRQYTLNPSDTLVKQ